MSSMNKKEQTKITANYHRWASRPEGLTLLALLLQKIVIFVAVASAALGSAAVFRRPDPPHFMVKIKQDDIFGMT